MIEVGMLPEVQAMNAFYRSHLKSNATQGWGTTLLKMGPITDVPIGDIVHYITTYTKEYLSTRGDEKVKTFHRGDIKTDTIKSDVVIFDTCDNVVVDTIDAHILLVRLTNSITIQHLSDKTIVLVLDSDEVKIVNADHSLMFIHGKIVTVPMQISNELVVMSDRCMFTHDVNNGRVNASDTYWNVAYAVNVFYNGHFMPESRLCNQRMYDQMFTYIPNRYMSDIITVFPNTKHVTPPSIVSGDNTVVASLLFTPVTYNVFKTGNYTDTLVQSTIESNTEILQDVTLAMADPLNVASPKAENVLVEVSSVLTTNIDDSILPEVSSVLPNNLSTSTPISSTGVAYPSVHNQGSTSYSFASDAQADPSAVIDNYSYTTDIANIRPIDIYDDITVYPVPDDCDIVVPDGPFDTGVSIVHEPPIESFHINIDPPPPRESTGIKIMSNTSFPSENPIETRKNRDPPWDHNLSSSNSIF